MGDAVPSVLGKAHQPELLLVAVPVLVWVGLGELCHVCDGAELQRCCWGPGSCCGEEVSDRELSTRVLCGPRILRQGPVCVLLPACTCVLCMGCVHIHECARVCMYTDFLALCARGSRGCNSRECISPLSWSSVAFLRRASKEGRKSGGNC